MLFMLIKGKGSLNTRSVKCVFLGYEDEIKCFKLRKMDGKGSKLLISKDVKFNEYSFPFFQGTNSSR